MQARFHSCSGMMVSARAWVSRAERMAGTRAAHSAWPSMSCPGAPETARRMEEGEEEEEAAAVIVVDGWDRRGNEGCLAFE